MHTDIINLAYVYSNMHTRCQGGPNMVTTTLRFSSLFLTYVYVLISDYSIDVDIAMQACKLSQDCFVKSNLSMKLNSST